MAKGIYIGASANSVANGDFSNGTNNWSITSYANATVKSDEAIGNYLHIDWVDTVTSGVVVYNSEMDFEDGDIIYISYTARAYSSNTSNTRCWVNILIPDISNDDTWHNISVIGTADGSRGTLISISQSKPSTIGNKLDITNIKFFNLTNMFGKGNEPTQEWCDTNLNVLEAKSIARKVKKVYVGVDNKARKVKKGYIGVGGVARPFFSAEQKLEYYGKATDLSIARYALAGASVGDYALFAGGNKTANAKVVDAYNNSLTHSTPTELTSEYSQYMAGANAGGEYALFAGGSGVNYVNAYSKTLVKSSPTNLSKFAYKLAGASIGNYAVFAGGQNSSNTMYANVDAYNKSLAKSTPSNLSVARSLLAGASVGDYVLFAGGDEDSYDAVNVVDAYNKSLVKSTPTALGTARWCLAGASAGGKYAIFAGGYTNSSYTSVVEAYDTSLAKSTPSSLQAGAYQLAGASIGDYAVFAGGQQSGAMSRACSYNSSLTRGSLTNLSQSRYTFAGASTGNYVLFAGGTTGNSNTSAVVDAYQLVG